MCMEYRQKDKQIDSKKKIGRWIVKYAYLHIHRQKDRGFLPPIAPAPTK